MTDFTKKIWKTFPYQCYLTKWLHCSVWRQNWGFSLWLPNNHSICLKTVTSVNQLALTTSCFDGSVILTIIYVIFDVSWWVYCVLICILHRCNHCPDPRTSSIIAPWCLLVCILLAGKYMYKCFKYHCTYTLKRPAGAGVSCQSPNFWVS